MSVNFKRYNSLLAEIKPYKAVLVAVSKTKPVNDIQELFESGQSDFGENYVNELVEKQSKLPKGIKWHFIGHLQSNKVKYIASFVYLIHGIDSEKLLREVSKQAVKNNRKIEVLLQVHIADEDTKFGLSDEECNELVASYLNDEFPGVIIRGLMGMASFTDDKDKVRIEFKKLFKLYDNLKEKEAYNFNILSMGMSGDYKIALEEGSTMLRIGSIIFGARS